MVQYLPAFSYWLKKIELDQLLDHLSISGSIQTHPEAQELAKCIVVVTTDLHPAGVLDREETTM